MSEPPTTPQPIDQDDHIMAMRGEDFFLNGPVVDDHTFGRDDMIPLQSDTILHSPVDIAVQTFESQFNQLDGDKWILRGTRHFASHRYQEFKCFHGIACCVTAVGMLRRLRARSWNEDTLDETLDCGWNFFRESLMERKGPIRRLVLSELKITFKIRDEVYKHKERGIVIWGKLTSSNNPNVFDICRGLETFFKECDTGILQIPGEYETGIWYEPEKYYMYHPWPADSNGIKVSLQSGGKACLLAFSNIRSMCDYFLENVKEWKMKPFSISDVRVYDIISALVEQSTTSFLVV